MRRSRKAVGPDRSRISKQQVLILRNPLTVVAASAIRCRKRDDADALLKFVDWWKPSGWTELPTRSPR
jgi:hypothetical protein